MTVKGSECGRVGLRVLSGVLVGVLVFGSLSVGLVGVVSAAPGDQLWSANLNGDKLSSPTIHDGSVYIGSGAGYLYVVNASTGAVEWYDQASVDPIWSSPTVWDGRVYVHANDGGLYAYNISNESQVWRTEIDSGRSSPTIQNGMLYVASANSTVYGINASTGDIQWQYSASGPGVPASPIVIGDSVFIGSRSGNMLSLDADTGSLQWSHNTSGEIWSSATYQDGTLYVGSNNGSVWAFDAGTGDVVWTHNVGAAVRSSPTVTGETLFVGADDGSVYALHISDGSLNWSFSTGAAVYSSPTYAGGMVYVGSNDNAVYGLYAVNGSERWSVFTGGDVRSSPTVWNGFVVVGSDDTDLYGYDTGHNMNSTGTRVVLQPLGHLGEAGHSVGPSAPPEPSENKFLILDVPELIQPNETRSYTVTLNNSGTFTNVTENATAVSGNTSILTVNQTTFTLRGNATANATVNVTANYTLDSGATINTTEEVVVAEVTVDNLEILPPIYRVGAVLNFGMGPGQTGTVFFLILATLMGAAGAALAGSTAGIAVMQLAILVGWFGGWVGLGLAMVSVFVALFIGLNTALNVDYGLPRR